MMVELTVYFGEHDRFNHLMAGNEMRLATIQFRLGSGFKHFDLKDYLINFKKDSNRTFFFIVR